MKLFRINALLPKFPILKSQHILGEIFQTDLLLAALLCLKQSRAVQSCEALWLNFTILTLLWNCLNWCHRSFLHTSSAKDYCSLLVHPPPLTPTAISSWGAVVQHWTLEVSSTNSDFFYDCFESLFLESSLKSSWSCPSSSAVRLHCNTAWQFLSMVSA